MRYETKLPSGCVVLFECDCDEAGQWIDEEAGPGYSSYEVDDSASCEAIERLRGWTIYQQAVGGREVRTPLVQALTDSDGDEDCLHDGFGWGDADTLISLLAILGDDDGWQAAGRPDSISIKAQSDSPAFWLFHDLAHAAAHWTVDASYDDPGAVFAPSDLDASMETEAHELGIRSAVESGYPIAAALGAVFDWRTLQHHFGRFGEPIAPQAILTDEVLSALSEANA